MKLRSRNTPSNPPAVPPEDVQTIGGDNQEVLEQLFKAIPFNFEDFKAFRLVSKAWFQATLPWWRLNAWLNIKDKVSKNLPSNTHLDIRKCITMLADPADPYQLCGEYPFRKYKVCLKKSLILSGQYRIGAGSLPLWTKLGSVMTHLNIFESNVPSNEDAKRILLEMTPNLVYISFKSNTILDRSGAVPVELRSNGVGRQADPAWEVKFAPGPREPLRNLRELDIRLGSSSFPIVWVYALARFPNVQVLKLREICQWKYPWTSRDHDLELFLSSIITIREKWDESCFAGLHHLDLLSANLYAVRKFPVDILLLLRRLQFPITSLALDIGFDQDNAGFKEILETVPALEKLTAYRGPNSFPIKINLPIDIEFQHLTELRLVGLIFENLHFLRDTPNLRVLVMLDLDGKTNMETSILHSYVDNGMEKLEKKVQSTQLYPNHANQVIASTNFEGVELTNCVVPSLNEFVVGSELCTVENVTQLSRIMPNLRKLRLGLDSDGFRRVCQTWGQLYSLDIEPFEIESNAISGFVDGQSQRNPGITDLPHLSWFRVGPPLNGKRDYASASKLLGAVMEGLRSTPHSKTLYFSDAPGFWRQSGLGGPAFTSPVDIHPGN